MKAKEQSGFDKDDDGWTVIGDSDTTSVKPDYDGVGGNPGGLITAEDEVTGGTWYFNAPAKYLGDNSDIIGKKLGFDIKITEITSPFGNYDVVLEGGGLMVAYNTSPDPGTDWTTFSVPLSASGWKKVDGEVSELTDDEFAALPDATDADFQTVMSALTALRIRGEFNTGADTGSLDNVLWGK